MNQPNKIITTQDPQLLDIRFWPTDICNFNCAYCFPGSVTNKLKYPKNVDTVIKNFRILFNSYISNHNKNKFKINIVGGGEPTLWPYLSEFCKGIKQQHQVHIQLTSNGSRTLRWWRENTDDVDEVVLSCHQAEVDIENFINVADYLFERKTDVTALMLMDASAWDKCVDLIEKMKQSKNKWIIQAKEVVDAQGHDILSYSESQLEYLKQPLKRTPDAEWIINNLHRFRIHESIALYDNGSAIPALPNYYIIQQVNDFKNWYCNVAIENLVITHDGSVRGSCQEQIFKNSNINLFSENFETQFNAELMTPTTIRCPFQRCQCQPDTHITKWRP
jgi:molybdenum cofactor biosynthesis enzyme MoaA